MMDVLEDLKWRGLLYQSTDEARLREHLQVPRAIYVGFDPTKDSLTIGNLVPILMLARLQRAGHRPVVVMGGGTGLIGDPSGKDQERQLLDEAAVQRNVESQRRIFEQVLDFTGSNACQLVNNLDWLQKLSYLEVLRAIGKHFSVNMMIQKDSVRLRLREREHGISYTEFSYMILQAYDFLELYRSRGVTVQLGGSDQWGNIVAGVDLVRRLHQQEIFGLTNSLVTKADGGKFGKTETGAVWLTRERTSPYRFYQFWLNSSDGDVEKYLKFFTFLERAEIEDIVSEHRQNPGARLAQRRLANEVTRILHGQTALEQAQAATQALFAGNPSSLSKEVLLDAFAEAPSSEHDKSALAGDGLDLSSLLPETTLAKSRRDARQLLESGAIALNGEKVSLGSRLTEKQLLHHSLALLRKGRKNWHVTRWR